MTTPLDNDAHHSSALDTDDALDIQARRRAGAKMGWYIHAAVYLLVNLGLVGLAASRGGTWAVFPLFGWGIGLLAHGFAVFFATAGSAFHERLVARERRALVQRQARDRW